MILGIDPGGAVALIDSKGQLVDVADLDELHAGAFLSPAMLRAVILDLCCDLPDSVHVCVVEKVRAMPGQGVSSMFSFGHGYGVCRAVPVAATAP